MVRVATVVFVVVSLFLVFAVFFSYPDKSFSGVSDSVGFTIHSLFPGFAFPYSFSESDVNSDLVFSSLDSVVSRSFNVSDTVIYRRGYVSYDGQAWQQFTLSTTNAVSGEWIYTKGTASINFSLAQLRMSLSRNVSNNTYVVVYSCLRNTASNSWDCHDGWQIIQFNAKINLQSSCSNDCSPSGIKQCSGITGFLTCGNYDSDACLEWSTITSCANGQTCSGAGICTAPSLTCSDGIQNQGEIGVDCGGPCAACSTPVTYLRTFYISSSLGNDNNNGTTPSSPWKTIAKVNSQTFKPGDGILFKRGDVFYGTITISSSGSSTYPITFSSYGTGDKPIVRGFTTITGWTDEGGGIYSKVITSESQTNMVIMDGVQQPMGRWPNSGWKTITSHVGTTSITDSTLTGSPNWVGAEVVIRKNRYIIDRSLITSHITNTIIYTSGSSNNANNGYGYFIQDSLLTLDKLGEWYHDTNTGKFYIYFGSNNPDNYDVKVSTINKLIYDYSYNYVTIDNLSLQGANWAAIHNYMTNYNNILNCDINLSGAYGIYGQTDRYSNIRYNTVDNCYDYGLYFDLNGHHHNIGYNTLTNIGMIAGMGEAQGGHYAGINVRGVNNIIEYNTLENIGYNGISFMESNATIQYNLVRNFCMIKDDGAGIYTYTGSEGVSYNRHIINNTIINGIGNSSGTNDASYTPANGIYLDDETENVVLSGNIIANIANYGIFLHNAANCEIKSNTVFNANKYVFRTSCDISGFIVKNVSVSNNIFIAKDATQVVFEAWTNQLNDILSWFSSDYNYYARPIADTQTISTNQPSTGGVSRTLAGWQSYSSQDVHSDKSPKSITSVNDLLFEYNPANVNKVVILSGNYIDVKGISYSGSVTLAPYTSIILIKN